MRHSGFFRRTFAGFCLDRVDLFNGLIHFLCQLRMNGFWIVPFYEIRGPTHAFKIFREILVTFTSQNRWIGNLGAIQMQDRQNCAIIDWIDKGI